MKNCKNGLIMNIIVKIIILISIVLNANSDVVTNLTEADKYYKKAGSWFKDKKYLEKAYILYKKASIESNLKSNDGIDSYIKLGKLHNELNKKPHYSLDGFFVLGNVYWFDMNTAKHRIYYDKDGWKHSCFNADTLLFGRKDVCKLSPKNGKCPAYTLFDGTYCDPS